ncbi:MAG: hypothetical protein ACI4IQ_00840 [Eubacterium sp.]
MTLQRYSADKHSAKYDLKHAFKSNLGAAAVTLVAMAYIFILNTFEEISYSRQSTMEKWIEAARENYTMLLHNSSIASYATGFICFICGALFAIASFRYIMNKKQVNVFYSSPIDRRTMFKNRTIASFVYMAGILILTIGIDAGMNIFFFAHPAFIIKNALIMLFISLVYMLLGFGIFAVAMAACTTSIEGFFFGGGLALIPSILFLSFDNLCFTFLNGWGREKISERLLYNWSSSLLDSNLISALANYNPLLFAKKVGAAGASDTIYSRVNRYSDLLAGKKDFGYKEIEMSYITPAIIWAVIAVLIIAAAGLIFIKRKAEKSGNYGESKITSAIFSLEIAVAVSTSGIVIMKDLIIDFNWVVLSFIIMIAVLVLTYYIALAITRKKIKHGVKSLSVPCSILGVIIICSGILFAGGFGYTTYVPNADEIEKAYITSSYANIGMSESNDWSSEIIPVAIAPEDDLLAIFTDKEDIEMFCNVVKSIPKKTDNMISDKNIYIRYELKNGKAVCRRYNRFDIDAPYNVLSLTNTKAYKDELEYLLSPVDGIGPFAKEISEFSDTYTTTNSESYYKYALDNGKAYITLNDFTSKEIENTDELKKALLEDLLNSDLQKRFKPQEKPLCKIEYKTVYDESAQNEGYIVTEEGEYYDEWYSDTTSGYYVYPSMTNTVNYLKEIGEYSSLNAIKLPQKAYIVDFYDSYYKENLAKIATYLLEYDTKNTDDWTMYQFKEIFANSQAITDKAEIEELRAASLPYGFANKNDYIVLFEYTDDSAFLPMLIKAEDMPDWANQRASGTIIGKADKKVAVSIS